MMPKLQPLMRNFARVYYVHELQPLMRNFARVYYVHELQPLMRNFARVVAVQCVLEQRHAKTPTPHA